IFVQGCFARPSKLPPAEPVRLPRSDTMSHIRNRLLLMSLFLLLPGTASTAAELKILLPLGRTAYQTNECIDISIARQAKGSLKASDLVLTLSGADGSKVSATFAVPAVESTGEARRTEHLHVNGWLLRPGKYTVEAASDGTSAKTEIEVFS